MMRAFLSYLCFCMISVSAHAQQPNQNDPRFFAVTVEPEYVMTNGAYVGAEIIVHIQFLSPDTLKRVRMDLPTIEGVRSEVLVRPHTLQIELEGDEGYSIVGNKVYSHEARLALVPTNSGTLVIPPITVKGISERQDGLSVEFAQTYPEQTITVHAQDPAFADGTWIVSRDVVMEETWSHAITEIENGETVRRTVNLTVVGIAADELPPLVLDAADGYRVLHTEVFTETEKTDTGFIAHLEQYWDIYVETEDVTYVAAVELPYWNPELGEAEIAAVPQQRIEPLKRDAMALRARLRDEAMAEHQAERLGLFILFALPVAVLGIILAMVLWRLLPTKADMRFWRDAGHTGAPLDFYRSFFAWGRQTFGHGLPLSREQLSALGDRAAEQASRLHRAVFGPRGDTFERKRVALALIWGTRRKAVSRFLSAFGPGLSRFLFLR